MEKKVMPVCYAVGFFGILTVLLGFVAEATRTKISDVYITRSGNCLYPASPAFALGIIASITLVIAQAIINFSAGCICCKTNPSTHASTCGLMICYIFSWITFVIALVLLIRGSLLSENGQQDTTFGTICHVVEPWIFGGAAILSLVSLTLGIIYYVSLSSPSVKNSEGVTAAANPHQVNIFMGQPQAQTVQPAFVSVPVQQAFVPVQQSFVPVQPAFAPVQPAFAPVKPAFAPYP